MTWKIKGFFSREAASATPAAETPGVLQTGAAEWFQRGNDHVSRQEWRPAVQCYEEAVRIDPGHAMAHAYLGNVFRQLREPEAAMAAYDRAIAARPDYAEVHFNRGTLLHQARQARAALDSYERALSLVPAFAEALCARGDVLAELGSLEKAQASYDAAIAANARYARAYLGRGVLLRAMGRSVDALASLDAAIALQPGIAAAHAERGLALMERSRPEEAVAAFDAAIRIRPDFARVFSNRAQAEALLGRTAAARASHDQAVSLDPHDAELRFNRGAFFDGQQEIQAATEDYQAAIALKPEYADAWCNLARAQQEAGDADQALASYARALAINPRLATAFNNRGNLYRHRHQFIEAARDYQAAIELAPDSAEAHFNQSQLALLQGDFAAGWREYEWRRLIREALTVPPRQFSQPEWSGRESLQGRQILLHAEQGLGDTIQFCRYAQRVSQLGARVVLQVPHSLGQLLGPLAGVSQLVLSGSPVPAADYHCSLMSLPRAFGTTLATIPREVPYLFAGAQRVARWQEALGPRVRPRIGVAWSGNPQHSNDRNRSVALQRLLAHLPDGFDYLCLQKEIRESDLQVLRSSARVRVVQSELHDFTDTAALMEILDLVITVDTSLAHLGGALGRKTWVLLPFLPDWRWLVGRSDSPWYPTLTLYRQPSAGDWDGAMAAMKNDLLQLHPR